MCVIATGQKKDFRPGEIQQCMTANPSGFFIAVVSGRTIKVALRTLDRQVVLNEFALAAPDDTILLHARIPSRGEKTIDNVHGWMEEGVRFCHNGTMHSLPKEEDKTDSETFFRRLFIPMWKGAEKTFNKDVEFLISCFAGASNKFAFLLPDGEIKLYGDYVSDHGCKFSNTSYKVYAPAKAASSCADSGDWEDGDWEAGDWGGRYYGSGWGGSYYAGLSRNTAWTSKVMPRENVRKWIDDMAAEVRALGPSRSIEDDEGTLAAVALARLGLGRAGELAATHYAALCAILRRSDGHDAFGAFTNGTSYGFDDIDELLLELYTAIVDPVLDATPKTKNDVVARAVIDYLGCIGGHIVENTTGNGIIVSKFQSAISVLEDEVRSAARLVGLSRGKPGKFWLPECGADGGLKIVSGAELLLPDTLQLSGEFDPAEDAPAVEEALALIATAAPVTPATPAVTTSVPAAKAASSKATTVVVKPPAKKKGA